MQIAADAMVAASAKHAFMGMTKMGMAAIFETRGNQDTHVILRGGKQGPNYDAASVDACCAVLRKAGQREQVMIDSRTPIPTSRTCARSRSRRTWPRSWPAATRASPA